MLTVVGQAETIKFSVTDDEGNQHFKHVWRFAGRTFRQSSGRRNFPIGNGQLINQLTGEIYEESQDNDFLYTT